LKDEVKLHREALAPLEDKHQKLESLHKELASKVKVAEQMSQNATKEMQKQVNKFENHDDDIDYSITQLCELSSKRERLETLLLEAKNKLQGLEEQLAHFPQSAELEQKYTTARENFIASKREYETAKREDRNQKAKFSELEETAGNKQQKLAKMNDNGARRRENVLRSTPNLGKICEWLDNNRSRFRRPVWGPVAVEITTTSEISTSYLEFHTPKNILKAFVVETREDYDLLYSEIRKERGIPINVISIEGNQLATTKMYSEAKMQILKDEYGVEGYLDDTFTAPDAVMIALQKFASVHKVLVGGQKAQDSIDRKQLRDFLAEPDHSLGHKGLQQSCIFTMSDRIKYRYTQSISRYSGKVGTRVDQVGAARLLAPGVPEAQKLQVGNELAELHRELAQLRPNVQNAEKAVKDWEVRSQECHLLEQAQKQQLENVATFQGRVDRQKQKVQDLEAELASDATQEKNDLTKSILNRLAHGIAAVNAHAEQQRLLMSYTALHAGILTNITTVRSEERAAL
jgi:structural maintenance of chromosomes protein 5